jgi:hypothetical protein
VDTRIVAGIVGLAEAQVSGFAASGVWAVAVEQVVERVAVEQVVEGVAGEQVAVEGVVDNVVVAALGERRMLLKGSHSLAQQA